MAFFGKEKEGHIFKFIIHFCILQMKMINKDLNQN